MSGRLQKCFGVGRGDAIPFSRRGKKRSARCGCAMRWNQVSAQVKQRAKLTAPNPPLHTGRVAASCSAAYNRGRPEVPCFETRGVWGIAKGEGRTLVPSAFFRGGSYLVCSRSYRTEAIVSLACGFRVLSCCDFFFNCEYHARHAPPAACHAEVLLAGRRRNAPR
jgi:hypothetical protein